MLSHGCSTVSFLMTLFVLLPDHTSCTQEYLAALGAAQSKYTGYYGGSHQSTAVAACIFFIFAFKSGSSQRSFLLIAGNWNASSCLLIVEVAATAMKLIITERANRILVNFDHENEMFATFVFRK